MSPAGSRAYVTNSGSNNISVIDITTNSVTATIPVGRAPSDVAVDSSGARIYVSNYDDDSVSIVDAAEGRVVASVKVGSKPRALAAN